MKSIHVASAYRALKSYHRKKLCGKCFSLWLMQASRSHRLPYRLSSAEAYRPIQHCKIFISRLHALLAQKAEMQDVVEFIDGCLLDLLANESVDCHVMILDTDSAKDIAICSTKPCTSKIETLRLTKAIVEAMEPESYVWQQQQPASKSLAMLQPAYVTLYPYAASATPYRILYMFVTKGWNGSRANELVARKSLDGAKNVSLLQICNLLRLSGLLIAPISIFLDNAAELLSQRLSKGLYRISESVDQAQQQLTSIKADLEAKELELEELRRSMKLKDELIKRLEGSRLKHKSHHQQLRNSLGNAEALLASRKSELERSKDTNKRLRERLK